MNQVNRDDLQELHASVIGSVQGVGFRDYIIRKAHSLGLRGYVRNERHGDVEVVAQGPRPALENFLVFLRQGPPAARVSEVKTTWKQPTEHFSGFHVRW